MMKVFMITIMTFTNNLEILHSTSGISQVMNCQLEKSFSDLVIKNLYTLYHKGKKPVAWLL